MRSNRVKLFTALAGLLKPDEPPSPAARQALDRVAEMVDPMLRVAPGFERKLIFPVSRALAYCTELVAALPGPVDIGRHAFGADPLVHALFATADDIDQMLGRSQAVRDFLAEPCSLEGDRFYAMIAARRQEKRQLGMVRQGDIVRNDVPQTVLYFSGQTLIEPSCRLDATQAGLRNKAFESLLHTFRNHVDAVRREAEGLRTDLAVERSHLTVLRGATGGREIEVRTRHLAELDAQLRSTCRTLMPEQLVDALADYLQAPEPALHLSPVEIAVDRLGIVQNASPPDNSAQTLHFAELTARDRRLHLAMLVRIDRAEAQAAVDKVIDQQHRFMVI